MRTTPFVNAAGFATQLAFVRPATLVIEVTVMVQVAVPAIIVPALKVTILGCVTLALPAHPAPLSTTVAPTVNCRLVGNVSTNAMPLCAGLPAAFVIVKIKDVAAFSLMGLLENVLVITGSGVTVRH